MGALALLAEDVAVLSGMPVRFAVSPDGKWGVDFYDMYRVQSPGGVVPQDSYDDMVDRLTVERTRLADQRGRKDDAQMRGESND